MMMIPILPFHHSFVNLLLLKVLRLPSLFVVLLLFFILVVVTDAKTDDCNLYLAPSSIPNVGLGVYAARDFELGEWIGDPSIAIPWINHPNNNDDDNDNDDSKSNKNLLLKNFLWDSAGIGGFGEASGGTYEPSVSSEGHRTTVSLFLPGIPSLIQTHVALENGTFEYIYFTSDEGIDTHKYSHFKICVFSNK